MYNNYAFVVSEALGHGMQVFDLTRLRGLSASSVRSFLAVYSHVFVGLMTEFQSPVRSFEADAVYSEFGSAHNIVINEDSGFAYAVGTKTCSGGTL